MEKSGWPGHRENKGFDLTFPDRENTGNLVNLIFYTGKNYANTGKILKILNFLKILLLKWQQGDGAFLS